jgi:thiol-disulfide isomerase/thioredoxin
MIPFASGPVGDNMQPLLVEIISEGPHCVPCEYAIAAVEYVSESYRNRIEVRVVETKRPQDAARYLDLCKIHRGILPMPSILFAGRMVFDAIPGPEELRRALDAALAEREESR